MYSTARTGGQHVQQLPTPADQRMQRCTVASGSGRGAASRFGRLRLPGWSRLALAGMLMPVGIAEVLVGVPPIFVLIGAIAMVLAVATLGVAVARIDMTLPRTP